MHKTGRDNSGIHRTVRKGNRDDCHQVITVFKSDSGKFCRGKSGTLKKKRYNTELFLQRILNLAKGFVRTLDPFKAIGLFQGVFFEGFVEFFKVLYET